MVKLGGVLRIIPKIAVVWLAGYEAAGLFPMFWSLVGRAVGQ